MKEQYTTEAINIKSYPLSENDKIVLMLTKNGLIRSVAKGVKKSKSKLGGNMELLVANKLLLSKGRNLDTICEARPLNTFYKIRYDLDKLTYAMYMSELVSIFSNNEISSNEVYDLFYKTLDLLALSNNKTEILFVTLKFQLHFMKISGYGLEFKKCMFCHSEIHENPVFSYSEGGVVCKNCMDKVSMKVAIPTKIQEFLSEISKTDIDKKTQFDELLNELVVYKCFSLMKKYIDTISPSKIKSLQVLNV